MQELACKEQRDEWIECDVRMCDIRREIKDTKVLCRGEWPLEGETKGHEAGIRLCGTLQNVEWV